MHGFCALLFDLCRFSSNSFKFLVAQARRLATGEHQIGQVYQKNTLNGKCRYIVDESVQGNLRSQQQLYTEKDGITDLPHSMLRHGRARGRRACCLR